LQRRSCLGTSRLVAGTKLSWVTQIGCGDKAVSRHPGWLRGQSCSEALGVGCENKVVSGFNVGGCKDEAVFSHPVPRHLELVAGIELSRGPMWWLQRRRATHGWSRDQSRVVVLEPPRVGCRVGVVSSHSGLVERLELSLSYCSWCRVGVVSGHSVAETRRFI
jgi:hypothetical protein